MFALGLALAASVSWGVADFLGGLKARSVPLFTLLLISQPVGFLVTAIAAVVADSYPQGVEWLWAAGAGMAGLIAVAAFYAGLARGSMSVIAPISASGAVIPLVVGLAKGDDPSALALAGVALALLGVALASAERQPGAGRSMAAGVPLALVAAAGFGLFFVGVDQATAEGEGFGAAFALRLTTLVALVVLALFIRPSLRLPRPELGALAAIGALDSLANIFFAVALTTGLLSLVSVVGSLYPVTTVLLAQLVLHERISGHQRVGVVAALIGVALIAAG